MKKIYLYVLFVCLCLFSVFFSVYDVYAAEDNKEYYINASYLNTSGNFVNQYTHYDYEFTLPSGYSVYVYPEPAIGNVVVILRDGATYYEDNLVHTGFIYRTYSDGSYATEKSPMTLNHIPIFNVTDYVGSLDDLGHSVSFSVYGTDVDTNIPYFESKSALADYVIRGIDDGWLNKSEIDYTGKHNFSNDEFLTTIPLPQLSSISHLGFAVDNLPDDMFIDVVAEFNFYGQHMKDDKYCTDYNWLYDSAQYDFTKADFANNNPVVNIKDFYDINPVDVYWSFFEKWSAAYPNLKDIPGYAWYNFTLGSQYIISNTVNDQIDYSTDSGKLSQLKASNSLETVYYIRFYNEEGHTGQWMKYVFRDKFDKGMPVGGSIISGAVSGSTPTGKPIVDTTINGDIDTDGNINLNPPTNDFTFNTDMDFSNFTYLLETSANVLQQFPLFISQLFLFLPWWVNALIACAIAMCILLRIVGR